MKDIFKKIIVSIITLEAKLILARYRPKIIAITGSVGKTSTKDAVFTVLSKFKIVRKSEKSFNSEIGLPLTILGCPNGWNNLFIWIENIFLGLFLILWKHPYPEYLILEVGVGKPGDIKKNVLPWLKTDVVIITHLPDKPVHVEFFDTVEKIIEEKSSLIYTLKKDGILILNHDDEKVYNLHQKANAKTISYGLNENATYHATFPTHMYKNLNDITIPEGINFKLEYEGNTYPVVLPHIIGLHYIGSALPSLVVASQVGCDILESIKAISEYRTPPGRLSYIEGINDSIIIDDTYNSSPLAIEAAFEFLKEIKGKRKIAVLGDMLELGKFTEGEHRLVGEKMIGIADILIAVGPRSKHIIEGALKKGFSQKNVYHFDSSKKTGEFLKTMIQKGDIILIKGSQGLRLERVIVDIMAYPEQKKKLLCRQEKEWQNRN